tara:strand:+ start:4156 stop:4680 length:525 start_codon:yes stop_codon:yes gene_type:complete
MKGRDDDFFGDVFGDEFWDDDELKKLGGLDSFLKGFREHHFKREEDLGEPDSIREFENGGHTFVEKTWDTPTGKVSMIDLTNTDDDMDEETTRKLINKLFFSGVETGDGTFNYSNLGHPLNDVQELDMEMTTEGHISLLTTKLDYCLAPHIENYERAAILRDMITELKEGKVSA